MESQPIRKNKIDELSQAALAGMSLLAQDATSAEVVSAVFTLAARTVLSVLEQPENKAHNETVLRDCITKLYAMIPADLIH